MSSHPDPPTPAGELSHKQRMLAGEPYLPDDELTADRRRARLATERLNATTMTDPPARQLILRGLLGGLGEETEILSPFQVTTATRSRSVRGRSSTSARWSSIRRRCGSATTSGWPPA